MSIAARIDDLCVSFDRREILHHVSFDIPARGITVLAGRSGSGKTTLLRALNRLNETFPLCHTSGRVELDLGQGLEPVYPAPGVAVRPLALLRSRVGMVFQTPNVLPVSVERNLVLPLEVVAGLPEAECRRRAENALKSVALWDEVKDRLSIHAAKLSGGQQQRLCLARALALEPAMLLLDEPTASLDVHATAEIEGLLLRLAGEYPLVVVTHNPQQAVRLGERLIVLADGRVRQCFERDGVDAHTLAGVLAGGLAEGLAGTDANAPGAAPEDASGAAPENAP